MEKKQIEVYIDVVDNEMIGFSGPKDIQIALVQFIENKKIILTKKLTNKFYDEPPAEYLDTYQGPSPICKGDDCD